MNVGPPLSCNLRNLHVTTVEPDAGRDRTAAIPPGSTDCEVAVTLDASASSDRDGHALRHQWYEGRTLLGEGETITVTLPVGEHCIRLFSTSDGGWAQDKLHVTVREVDPPEIRSISVTPKSLWPANHRMRDVHVEVEAWDVGTADFDGSLRAERSGTGAGREYTLTYEVTDASGNVATATATVRVGHDRAGNGRAQRSNRAWPGPRGWR